MQNMLWYFMSKPILERYYIFCVILVVYTPDVHAFISNYNTYI